MTTDVHALLNISVFAVAVVVVRIIEEFENLDIVRIYKLPTVHCI